MLTIALICTSYFISIISADCSIPPIYLDIRPREVEGAKNALSYGLSINIGTPIQQLSLWPSLDLNEITLADTNFCSTPSSSCTASTAHGLFNPTKSRSFANTPPSTQDNTSTLTGSISTLSSSGTDTLHLWSALNPDTTPPATNLSDFPLQLLSNYTSATTSPFFSPAGLLGLGPSSTLLASLHAAGRIASRSYGLFLGTGYPRDNATGADASPVNGSLILGGYDSARFQQPVESFPISSSDSDSGLTLPLTAITLSNSTTNLLHYPLTIHLSTSESSLTLPSSLSPLLSSSSSQLLSLTLGPNLTIALPTSSITFSSSAPYILGLPALQSLYLIVSAESSSFFLAPALPDAVFAAPAALCAGQRPMPLGDTRMSGFVRNGLVGLVVGVGVAGTAVGVLVGLVGRACWRGRMRRRDRGGLKGEIEMGDIDGSEERRKGWKVRVAEKESWDDDQDQTMYFAPPPRRATVVMERCERKMGLKGVLKVKSVGI